MWYNKLDPPLGGRRSRNSHYTISFKKSQEKSSRRIAQSFFPKSLFFVQPAQPASAGVPQLSPHMRPLLFGSPGPGAYARRAERKLAPQKFFYRFGDRRVALIFPYGRDIARNLACCPQKIFLTLSPGKIGPIAKIERVQ